MHQEAVIAVVATYGTVLCWVLHKRLGWGKVRLSRLLAEVTADFEAVNQGYFTAGLQMGRQQILDMMSLALRDPSIMGKDTFGKDRLLKLVKAIGEYIDKYQPAWEKKEETDYYRAKLDASLAEAYGAGMHDTFMERYEFVPEFDYFTGKWRK